LSSFFFGNARQVAWGDPRQFPAFLTSIAKGSAASVPFFPFTITLMTARSFRSFDFVLSSSLATDNSLQFFPLSALAMLMLKLQAPAVTWWILLLSWHARLYHANIRSDFGPLRYLLVTPQSHRVHHSRDLAHLNHNYGATLSIWDYLFGTQFRRYDVYPETGIADERFPAETAQSVSGVLAAPMRQMLYPFGQLWMSRKGA
jgi:fatty acid hydroxylase family protein